MVRVRSAGEGIDVFRFPDRGLYAGEQLVFTRDSCGRATRGVAKNSPAQFRHALNRDPRCVESMNSGCGLELADARLTVAGLSVSA